MKHLPIDMPVTIAEQDEVLERIFAMVDLGDSRTTRVRGGRTLKRKRRAKRRRPEAQSGVRFEVVLSLQEHAMLAALMKCREICAPRQRSLVKALQYTIAVATFCHGDSPELDWPEHFRAFVQKAKRGGVLRGRLPEGELQALDRLATEMGVSRSAAMRASLVSLYTTYQEDDVLP